MIKVGLITDELRSNGRSMAAAAAMVHLQLEGRALLGGRRRWRWDERFRDRRAFDVKGFGAVTCRSFRPPALPLRLLAGARWCGFEENVTSIITAFEHAFAVCTKLPPVGDSGRPHQGYRTG